jgi:predicted ester cyclase
VEVAAHNKLLVERMHAELLEKRDPGIVDRYFAPGFVSHNMPPGFPPGAGGVRRFFTVLAAALKDVTVTVDAIVAEGDLVAVRTTTRGTHTGRLFGIPPSGRQLAIDGTDIVRLKDDRIVEHWGLTNTVGALQQVGAIARLRWLGRLVLGRR